MKNRYLNSPYPGSAKVPSTLYYDHNGNFLGIENGIDFQDEEAYVRMRWWEIVIYLAV